MSLKVLNCWGLVAALLSVNAPANATNDSDIKDYQERRKVFSYTNQVLKPYFNNHIAIQRACDEANQQRSTWKSYTDVWKEWSFDRYPKEPSYDLAEFKWTILKDQAFRDQHLEGSVSNLLREYKANSKEVIGEIFLTDSRGGNIAQSNLTTDWYQGDEQKFTQSSDSQKIYVGKIANDTSAKRQGIHISIPILDKEQESLKCMAILLVIPENLK